MRLNATLLYYCFGKTSFGTSVGHHSTHSGCRTSGLEPRELHMREFLDSDGDGWVATVRSEEGLDFKGRHYLYFHPAGAEDDGLELLDVRWNSPETAERTLATMSGVELRRRLRSALGRRASLGRGSGSGGHVATEIG